MDHVDITPSGFSDHHMVVLHILFPRLEIVVLPIGPSMRVFYKMTLFLSPSEPFGKFYD